MERDTAKYVWISELLNSTLVQEEDSPGGVLLPDGTAVYRCRIYGVVVSGLVVDDGSGCILVRNFDSSFNVDIGDPVLVIGRPRIFNGQCYVLGEIVKKVDPKWFELRNRLHPGKDALSVVRSLDRGDGADYDAVVSRLGEEKVVHLLSVGELFETRPGKLKVLE